MLEAMLQRIENGHQAFVEVLRAAGDISQADALRVKTLYLKHRLAKMDTGIGRISVKHGAYLERDVIQRAVDMA